jgi:hypothetical protein
VLRNSLCLVVSANQVVDDIRVPHAFFDLSVIAHIPFLRTAFSIMVAATVKDGQPTMRTICPRSPMDSQRRVRVSRLAVSLGIQVRTHHSEMSLLVLISVWKHDLRALLCELVDKVASQEASASEYGRYMAAL